MKTIFKKLGAGVLMAGCIAVAGINAFAQDAPAADVCKEIEAQQALYKTFTENIPKNATLDQTKTAIKAGDDYVQKYGACPESKQIVDYLNKYLPGMKDTVAKITKQNDTDALLGRFNTAVTGTNKVADPVATYAAGKEIVALNDKFQTDVLIVLGSAGLDQATAATPVDTYNDQTISYAKQAIQKLEANSPSATGNYGVLQYSYKTKDFPDGKANALGALNYNIGYITYYRQGKDNPAKKKEALPYLYKATQYNSFAQKNPFVYQTIGAWYLDEAIRIDKERQEKLKANGNKDTEETLAMVGMQKGYADRAIDAYARAYKIAKDNKDSKPDYVNALYSKLKDLYAFRFDNNTSGIDQFVATVQTKPLPDPTTAITPVAVEPTPTETTPTTNTTTPPAMDTTKPATDTTKPATTPATKPTTTPTTPAKKPVSSTDATAPKKKGTR